MEYEVGSVADLISGLLTPERARARGRGRPATPTKRQLPPPNTPQAESPAPLRPAPFRLNELSSPRTSRPNRQAKIANNFQFLSQLDDGEHLAEATDRRAKLLQKGKDPEKIIREYYEDKNGIVELTDKKDECKTLSDEKKVDAEQNVSDSLKTKKKAKKEKKKTVEPIYSPFEEAMKNEILDKVSKLKSKKQNKENNDKDTSENIAEIKNSKKKSRVLLHCDNVDANDADKKKKRKRKLVEPTEDLTSEKSIKKKKSKNTEENDNNVELDNTAPIDDGEDFARDEDEGEALTDFQKSAKRRIESKMKKEKKFETNEIERTLFVGNIPVSILKLKYKKILKNKFSKYGAIESVRVRNIPVVDFKTKPMVALIENKFHPERSSVTAYIKFKESSSVEKALVENNTLIDGNHIRVDNCRSTKPQTDNRRTLFLGNLPFNVEEETVRNLFDKCGSIDSIRVIRDKKTQIGKGFGFVNFTKADGVELALSYPEEDLKIGNKVIRIKRYNTNPNLMRDDGNNHNDRGSKRNNVDAGRADHYRTDQTNRKSLGKKRDDQGNKLRKRNLVGNNIKNKYKQKAQYNPDLSGDVEKNVTDSNFPNTVEKKSADEGVKDGVKKVDSNSYVGVMAKKKKKQKINKGVLKKKKISKILMHNLNATK